MSSQLANKLNNLCSRIQSIQGDVGPTGPQGPQGDVGPQGIQGPQGMTGLSIFAYHFATVQSIGNNDYIGLGTSSPSFYRNTLVIPNDGKLTSITLNIRALTKNTNIISEVYRLQLDATGKLPNPIPIEGTATTYG